MPSAAGGRENMATFTSISEYLHILGESSWHKETPSLISLSDELLFSKSGPEMPEGPQGIFDTFVIN